MKKVFKYFILIISVFTMLSACGGGGSAVPESISSDTNAVAADKASLNITYTPGDSASSVKGNLTLPTSGQSGTTISWSSSMTSIISNTGIVTRPSFSAGDKPVAFTATISRGSASDTKQFILTVKEAPETDAEAVAADKASLNITYTPGDSASSVKGNLTLPTSGQSGTTISWSSSMTSIISNTGIVTRPSFSAGDKPVAFTATISRGSASDTKQFILTVKEAPETDAEAVAADKASLNITYTPGDSASSVTGNLTLPTSGQSGTTISWSSSMTSIISDAGMVTRPINSDATVTLTATIRKGLASDTKQFSLTVKTVNAAMVTTLAGSAGAPGWTDGTGPAARFHYPIGITTDGTNLYVNDYGSCTIRKIVIATGAVTTIAGSAWAIGSDDGTGSAARFHYPWGISTDGTNLYVVDYGNDTIRKIVIATGAVTTIAGSAGVAGSADGTGSAARFSDPKGITTDGTNLYVVDNLNYTIRKIVIATGAVTTIAGSVGVSGSADGTGSAARFYHPVGITTDGTNLYVADAWNHTIRKVVIATGAVTTIAGSARAPGWTDGTGPAARFNYPKGITSDGTNLYVADHYNNIIRKVVIATGTVTTIAGSAGVAGSADGTGSAARFNYPEGITTDEANLYVADWGNSTIRKIQFQ